MNNLKHYDYIIAGAGAAGLSLAIHLIEAGLLIDKTLLIVDKSRKDTNDRTWCFWEDKSGLFERCVGKSWKFVKFKSTNFNKELNINPFIYKMISGKSFYKYCLEIINKNSSIKIIQEEIIEINHPAQLVTNNGIYSADIIFNSAIYEIPKKSNSHYLLQHFKGWFVETEQDFFNEEVATLMDFSIDQQNDCRFIYVLPFTPKTALIEYTVFSEKLLTDSEYENALANYLKNDLRLNNFKITEKEFGVIPMTNVKIPHYSGGKILNIGTAGGATKASSGYTFKFIQKQCEQIIEGIKKGKPINEFIISKSSRFEFYDSVFLRVIKEKKQQPSLIFTQMFSKLPPILPLKFLNESTSLFEELKVISVFNKILFTVAAIKELMIKKS